MQLYHIHRLQKISFWCCITLLFPFILLGTPQDPPLDSVDYYVGRYEELIQTDTSFALLQLHKALDYAASDNGDINLLFKTVLQLGRYYMVKGDIRKSLKHLEQFDSIAISNQPADLKNWYYIMLGQNYYHLGNYNLASELYLKSLAACEVTDSLCLSIAYRSVGTVYWRLGNYDEALKYHLRSLKYNEGTDPKAYSKSLGNIGLIYRSKNDYDKALSYYEKSLAINRENNYLLDAAINLQNIGVVHQKKGNLEEALQYFIESNEISKSIDDQIGVLYSNHGIAAILGKMGKHDLAKKELLDALLLAEKMGIKEEIKLIYLSLSDLHQINGQYEDALTYHQKYVQWKDSLVNEKHLNQVKDLELKYESEKKDQQIDLLAKEKEIQERETSRQSTLKWIFAGSLLILAAFFTVVFYLKKQQFKNHRLISAKDKELREMDHQRQMSELKMEALRAQINPHFLFNCMNSINSMILEGQNEQSSYYLTKFSKLVRLILEKSDESTISLEDELAILEAYIQLESLRFGGKIDYQIVIEKELDIYKIQVPTMILQPFVENAIWHGLMHRENTENGKIVITIIENNGEVKLTIEDNGIGREKAQELAKESVVKNKSLGLKITQERLRLWARDNLEHLIKIIDLKDKLNKALGTRVEINIPLN